MDERQQVKYIAENISWLAPETLYRKTDMLLEYLSSVEMSGLSRQQKNNIADWLKCKIVVIADAKRKMLIAEELGNNPNKEEDTNDYAYTHEEYIDYDDDNDFSDEDDKMKKKYSFFG